MSFFFHASEASSDDYRLGPEDVIEVRVFELDQLNRTLRVSGDGKIELPLVGSVEVTGLTPNQVATQIADRLRDRYVQNPQVSIFITEFKSQKVSLLGAVATPASYPLSGQRRLLQLLAEAGSLGPEAGSTLYVFRQTEDGRSARLTVPLNELLLQGDPRWNVLLRSGDVISVPPEQAIAGHRPRRGEHSRSAQAPRRRGSDALESGGSRGRTQRARLQKREFKSSAAKATEARR